MRSSYVVKNTKKKENKNKKIPNVYYPGVRTSIAWESTRRLTGSLFVAEYWSSILLIGFSNILLCVQMSGTTSPKVDGQMSWRRVPDVQVSETCNQKSFTLESFW
ncbi:hypothetical protein OUZ56_026194 [Daphnia magna]|uniref:Uncharacterized protein n=1 Tax=Daphnia magna TaxID=35525 RepID=A0ABQ9ZL52_9CRUS|nr:hypothetical protein OUZ56_026194 [Daphnia magna]